MWLMKGWHLESIGISQGRMTCCRLKSLDSLEEKNELRTCMDIYIYIFTYAGLYICGYIYTSNLGVYFLFWGIDL